MTEGNSCYSLETVPDVYTSLQFKEKLTMGTWWKLLSMKGDKNKAKSSIFARTLPEKRITE